jgi:hypothetical protein
MLAKARDDAPIPKEADDAAEARWYLAKDVKGNGMDLCLLVFMFCVGIVLCWYRSSSHWADDGRRLCGESISQAGHVARMAMTVTGTPSV